MADSSRYQPYGDYYWCGTGAYWDYPPNPMYTYGEPEALQRPTTPANDYPVGGDGKRESGSESDDGHPPTTDFQIGYFSSKQSTKYWIMCQEDLDSLNKLVEKRAGSVMLWCDGKSAPGLEPNTSTSGTKRKKKADDPPPTKRQQIEDELESVVKDLQEKHGNKYTLPQLRCWARMITSGKYQDRDTIPIFLDLNNQPKKQKRSSLAEAITGAAMTFAKAVKSSDVQQCSSQSVVIASSNSPPTPVAGSSTNSLPLTAGISQGKIMDLRLKKVHELRELQGLFEQNILTQQEFVEKKQLVLDSLRKLTH